MNWGRNIMDVSIKQAQFEVALLNDIENCKHRLYEESGRFKWKKDNAKKLSYNNKFKDSMMTESSTNVTHRWHIECQGSKGKLREILLTSSHKQIATERVNLKQRSVVKLSKYCWNQHDTWRCGQLWTHTSRRDLVIEEKTSTVVRLVMRQRIIYLIMLTH